MRLAVPLCLACTALLTVALQATGATKTIPQPCPHLVAHAATPERFVPAGWHLEVVKKGDLNADGISDAVLVMEKGNNGDAYRLVIVFGNSAGGFDLAADNSELLNGVPYGGFAPYPVSEGFKIHHDAFTIEMRRDGPGGVADITFTFRHQDSRFVLISDA
jgi:hypothetical protein